jgi:hypothetical protein
MAKPPKEYRQGRIVLPLPENPIRGRNHVRVRFYVDRPKDDVTVLKWYLRQLKESQDSQYGYPYPHLEQSTKGCFLSPEAFDLYSQHKEFWRTLAARHLITKAQERETSALSERSRKKEATTSRRTAARNAGIANSDLKRKLMRFSDMLATADTLSLAVEVVRAADVSFLKAVLAGAQLDTPPRQRGQQSVNWHPGELFARSIGYTSKDDFWEEKASTEPAWLVFWLAVARCIALRSRPKGVHVTSLRHIRFAIRTVVDADVLVEVLGILNHFEKVQICTGGLPFTTASLPALTRMTVLSFMEASDNAMVPCDLSIDGLQKHPALKVISITCRATIRMADDQVALFDRIRLESTSLALTNSLKCLTESPPDIPSRVVSLDRNTARVFVRMATDHSRSKKRPLWWRPAWRTSRRWADRWKPTWDHELRFKSGRIHLPECEELSADAAAVLVQSGLPLLIAARCITPDVARKLATAKGPLGIASVESGRELPKGFWELAAETLYFDCTGHISVELARRLAAFRGECLLLACADLTTETAATLSMYSGALVLATSEARPPDGVVVADEVAQKLSAARGTVRFMGAGDSPTGRWLMPQTVCDTLNTATNIKLGDYRKRVFAKRATCGMALVSVQLYSRPTKKSLVLGGELECAITTQLGNKSRTAVKQLGKMHFAGYWQPRLERLCQEFVERGFVERTVE